MPNETRSNTVTVQNPRGLHLRTAYLLSQAANEFTCKIELVKDDMRIDGKSPLSILTLCATQGTQLNVEATGADADEAVKALSELINTGFAELAPEEQSLND